MTPRRRGRRATQVTEHFVAIPRASVHTIPEGDETLLFDQNRARLVRLNAPGGLVWACLDGASAIGEIVTDISVELDVPRATVLADALALTRRLGDEGVLENLPPAINQTDGEAPPPDGAAVVDPRFVPVPPNP